MKYLLVAILFSGCSVLQKDKGLCECECKANCLDVQFTENYKETK